MLDLDKKTIEEILIYFYENDPQMYLIHDDININNLDKETVTKYIPRLYEAGYLQGFFVEIGSNNGKYAIGGLTQIGREAVRQHFLGNTISIYKKY